MARADWVIRAVRRYALMITARLPEASAGLADGDVHSQIGEPAEVRLGSGAPLMA
ncbi:hypothetical protein GCM10020220_034510 [Nonomuraea rubra]